MFTLIGYYGFYSRLYTLRFSFVFRDRIVLLTFNAVVPSILAISLGFRFSSQYNFTISTYLPILLISHLLLRNSLSTVRYVDFTSSVYDYLDLVMNSYYCVVFQLQNNAESVKFISVTVFYIPTFITFSYFNFYSMNVINAISSSNIDRSINFSTSAYTKVNGSLKITPPLRESNSLGYTCSLRKSPVEYVNTFLVTTLGKFEFPISTFVHAMIFLSRTLVYDGLIRPS